jgi:multidrug resistance efflux pump
MVIQINVKNPEKLEKGDVLVYAGNEKFEVVKKEELIKPLEIKIAQLEQEIVFLKAQATNVKDKTNQKLKNFMLAFAKKEKK